jgi:hypothetical protein
VVAPAAGAGVVVVAVGVPLGAAAAPEVHSGATPGGLLSAPDAVETPSVAAVAASVDPLADHSAADAVETPSAAASVVSLAAAQGFPLSGIADLAEPPLAADAVTPAVARQDVAASLLLSF